MRIQGRLSGAAVAGLLATLFVAGLALDAQAEPKGRSIQTEARWIKFDPATNTVVAKIQKVKGKPKLKEAAVHVGKEESFDVKPEGSVLTRTTVAVNGKKGELTDIPAGKVVNIYWVPDASKPTKRFARKIDVILSEEELDERYGTE
jgi:hypothetical protein